MIKISDYILRSYPIRIEHLRLEEPCLERGGYSTKFCGVLAEGLGTTIPEKKTDGVNVHLCHACHNAKCSNVRHLYWGTPRENFADSVSCGKLHVWDATVRKYGYDTAIEMARRHQKQLGSLGGKAGKGKPKTKKRHGSGE